MAGGSGSRNSTPPVGRPSSTPTPPQVRTTLGSSRLLTHLIKMRRRQEVATVSSGACTLRCPLCAQYKPVVVTALGRFTVFVHVTFPCVHCAVRTVSVATAGVNTSGCFERFDVRADRRPLRQEENCAPAGSHQEEIRGDDQRRELLGALQLPQPEAFARSRGPPRSPRVCTTSKVSKCVNRGRGKSWSAFFKWNLPCNLANDSFNPTPASSLSSPLHSLFYSILHTCAVFLVLISSTESPQVLLAVGSPFHKENCT